MCKRMKSRTENRYLTARRGEEHHMISRRLFSFILIGILAGASACRIGPTFGPPPPPGPAPVISSISPMSAAAGGAAFTLTVNGSHFLSGADLVWRNPDNPGFSGGQVTLVNSSLVTIQIPAAEIAIPGSAQILIFNPDLSPDSNTVMFVINPGPPGGAQVISPGANGAPPNGNSHDPIHWLSRILVPFRRSPSRRCIHWFPLYCDQSRYFEYDVSAGLCAGRLLACHFGPYVHSHHSARVRYPGRRRTQRCDVSIHLRK